MRRVRFNIALTYNSKPEQIIGIIDEIKSIIVSHPKTGDEFVVRFVDFDSSSLNILVIYFVKSNEFEVMVDVKEQINLNIMKIIEKHGCAFAFPTQTIHLQQ
jgi:MscS family membrane protein